ncbi:MAG: AAA family ATPase, partial [Armatimonadetes bacterium]|nr:AAA family ATPase [Armatimonadota bacterium]
LLSDGGGEGDLRRAMWAGARECLAWPVQAARLAAVVRTVHEEQRRRRSTSFAEAADPQNMARIIAVSGAKGGVGKTTLAVNLALALLMETGQPTVLMDLYTQFGDVAMLLNLSPRRSLAELAARPAAVDGALLDDHFERHESGLRVLIGARSPAALDAISAPFLDRVLGLLKGSARFVVLDVPPILHPTTLHALSHATQVLLTANLYDLTTAKDTRLLLEAIEGRYVPREKLSVILNRVSRQNRLCVPDIEEALGRPAAAQVPNDGKIVPHSINQGAPFVLSQPHSAVAQSVRHLACQVAADGPRVPDAGAGRSGFWRRWAR